MISISHDVVQGRICPRIDLQREGQTSLYVYRGFKGGMTISNMTTGVMLLNWSYDPIARSWRQPAYGEGEGVKELVDLLLEQIHEVLDSDEAIEYFASLKPDPLEEPATSESKPRSAYSKVLGALSDHLKADETTATRTEYLMRRRSSLAGVARRATAPRPVVAAPPPQAGAFKPDLSNLS